VETFKEKKKAGCMKCENQ